MNNDGRFVPRHRIRLVSIAKGVEVAQSTYDAGRFAWPVNEKRAKKIELVLGCVKGMVMPRKRISRLLSQRTKAFDGDLKVWKQTRLPQQTT